MHSFRQSRARIAFEVLCALTVSLSCAGAWIQTGATAFLPAAVATGLFGLWHLTDLRRQSGEPAVAAQAQTKLVGPVEVVEAPPAVVIEAEEAPKPKKRSRKKQPETEKLVSAAEVAEPDPIADFPDRAAIEEELHPPIAPLFEPKPFALQQRPSFGRKAG
jgi:hypothetical protein